MSNNGGGRRPQPLRGVKVVEYGVFHAGPGAGAILGDLGADVIKIEGGIGDPERYWTMIGGMDMSGPDGHSMMFEVSNRNKKGIYLDIKQEKGRDVFNRLIEDADVFMTNIRKSTRIKMGLDYEAISKINPKIVQACVSGYGPEGPMSDLGAFDPLGQARSGMMFMTGDSEPHLVHLAVLDQATAIAASHAIITALYVRERDGIGQEVHVSLYSTGMWLMYPNIMLTSYLPVNPTIHSTRSSHSPLRNCFICKDGKWIMGTHHPEDRYWPTFCEAVERPDLIDDPRYNNDKSRSENCTELVAMFDGIFATKTRDEWMDIFRPLGLMFSSVLNLSEIKDDEQALVNDYMVQFNHPKLGDKMVPGYPIHFSANSAGMSSSAPAIGQHTREILLNAGYGEEVIADMLEEGIIK